MDPLWSTVSTNTGVLDQIAVSIGRESAAELPPLDQITDSQLQAIGRQVGGTIAGKVEILRNAGNVNHPSLDEPAIDIGDASALTLMMMELQAKLGDLQVGTAKEGVQISKERLKEASDQRLNKLKEAIEKMEKASEAGIWGKVFSWIGAIAGLVVAAVATVATGGALAAVGLGLAVASIALLTMEETGAMDQLMTAMFGDDEKAKMIFQFALMGVMLLASLATMGAGLTQAASKSAAFGARLASESAKAAARVTQMTATGVGGLAAIGGGIANVKASVNNYEATTTQAESKEMEAWIAKLQALLQDNQDELQKALEALQNGNRMITDILKSNAESKSAVTMNLGA